MHMDSGVNAEFLFDLKKSGRRPVIDWCISVGLLANTYKCCRCGRRMKLIEKKEAADGFEWQCRAYGVNGHDVKRSIRKGSCLGESSLGLVDILLITYYWVNCLSTKFIIKDLRLNSEFVNDWRSICREVCIEICMNESSVLGGVGVTVEVHQSKLGNRKMNLRKSGTGNWMLIGVERGTNKLFFRIVDEINRDILLDEIKTYILPGTTIESDCWQIHNCYDDEEFQQFVASQSLYLTEPEFSQQNAADKSWGIFDHRFLDSSCTERTDCYLAEAMWRKNHNNEETLESFIDALLKVYPPRKED